MKRPFQKIVSSLQEFIQDSRAVGIVLLACTVIALLVANSAWGHSFHHVLEYPFLAVDGLHLPKDAMEWINDGLMALFFFLVGMEIKKQLLDGELRSWKNASLPFAGALGGMLVPALIFILICRGTEYQHGWGIPMATDIAFSLGVSSLLGNRVPVSLKIFLMALAIIDDLGAILVIAFFYGGHIHVGFLLAALGVYALLLVLSRWRFSFWTLLPLGLLLWLLILNSGIHATIAGVLVATAVPTEKLEHWIHRLHDPVNFVVLPIFALANTAIIIPDNWVDGLYTPLSLGVAAGLVIGKPLGITLFSWLVVKLGWGVKPRGASWLSLLGMATLAGIGFTMSIFITLLAFDELVWQNMSKIAILVAALLSVVLGLVMLYFTGNSDPASAVTED